MKRSRKLVEMALKGLRPSSSSASSSMKTQYSVVKIIEFETFKIVPSDQVHISHTDGVHMISHNGKDCWCIIYKHGDLHEMQTELNQLVKFNDLERQCKIWSRPSISTQTDALNRLEMETQTGDIDIPLDGTPVEILAPTDANITEEHPMPTDESFEHTNLAEPEVEIMPSEHPVEGLHQVGPDNSLVLVQLPSKKGADSSIEYNVVVMDVAATDADKTTVTAVDDSHEGLPLQPGPSTSTSALECFSPPLLELPEGVYTLTSEGTLENIDEHPARQIYGPSTSTSALDCSYAPSPLELPEGVYTLTSEGTLEQTDEHPARQINDPSATKSRKKQFCIFCKKTVNFVIGHIKSKHNNEDRIKGIMALNSNDMQKELVNIRNEGNKEYYGTVIARKGGKSDYIPCIKCNLSFSKNNLYKHHFKCTGNKAPKNLQDVIKKTILVENTNTFKICENLKKHVLAGMSSSEELINAIINDKEIVDQGNTLCLKFGMETLHQKNLIRTKLLRLAKVRLGMSKLDSSITSLVHVFNKDQWSNLMEVVLELSKLTEKDLKKQSPTNVLHIGLDLSGAAKDLKAKLPEDSPERAKIKGWLEMFERFYKSSIGYQATKVALKKKWKGRNLAPVGKDIFALNMYIKSNMSKSLEKLQNGYCEDAFVTLSKCAMVFLLIFNRKRVGEITNITVSDYNRKAKIRKDSDIYLGLTEAEKLMADNYYHLLIRGKLARPVPLLISNDLAECVDCLLKYRTRHGVNEENEHLFAKPGISFYDGNFVLREAANDCGASRPEDLTSTRLRKHIATVSQSLNMSEADLRLLSGYMGHTATTHIQEYTLPVDAAHATQVSRILSALNSGRIHEFRGKKINEINIDIPIAIEDIDFEEDQEEATKKEPPTNTLIKSRTTKSGMKRKNTQDKKSTVEEPHCSKETTPEKRSPYAESEQFFLTPTPPKKSNKKPRWSTPEKTAMKRQFSKHILIEKAPTDSECRTAKTKSSPLKRRKPYLMKAWVNNQIKKRRREKALKGDESDDKSDSDE